MAVRRGVRLLAVVLLCGGVVACDRPPARQPARPSTSVAASPTASPSSAPPTRSAAQLHYISNTGPDRTRPAQLGYNLVDIAPDKTKIDALPAGSWALVWLGNLDNTSCTPGFTWSEFTAAVDTLAGDRKVFGYYLSDEPHPSFCPAAVAHIRQRADYIRARDPVQKSFIVVLDSSKICVHNPGCEYEQLRPALSHVDYIGIDPFPCNALSGCHFEKIDSAVQDATAKGVPAAAMVPVIQVFGQYCNTEQTHYYILPTVAQMHEMLARWDALVPNPTFDFSYTWRSKGPACPALDKANGTAGYADLQSIMREHNGG